MYVDLNLTDGTCRHPPQEYADFMRQVESESAAVATQQAAEDEDQAAERRERDAFEQLYVCLLYGDATEHSGLQGALESGYESSDAKIPPQCAPPAIGGA